MVLIGGWWTRGGFERKRHVALPKYNLCREALSFLVFCVLVEKQLSVFITVCLKNHVNICIILQNNRETSISWSSHNRNWAFFSFALIKCKLPPQSCPLISFLFFYFFSDFSLTCTWIEHTKVTVVPTPLYTAFCCVFFLQLLTKARAQTLGDCGQVFQSFHQIYYFKLLITPFQESHNCHVNASFPVYMVQEPETVFKTSQRTWWKIMYFPRLVVRAEFTNVYYFFFFDQQFFIYF